MAGKSKWKLNAEMIVGGRSGWSLDPAHHSGAVAAYQALFGAAPAQVAGTHLVGSGKGRGPMVIDAFRRRVDGKGFDFLSVKGFQPWPSKVVVSTAKGAEVLIDAALLGLTIPVVMLAMFEDFRVGVRIFDMGDLIRTHGVSRMAPGQTKWGKGKAPPLSWATTTRKSGGKSRKALIAAGVFSETEADALGLGTRSYERIEMSLAALGWSRGRGWSMFAARGDDYDYALIHDRINNDPIWASARYEPMIF